MNEQIETPEFAAETSAPVSAGTETTPTAPSPVNLADDALVEIKVGGETKLVPWSEARTGFMLHGDYTRKQQAFAKERSEFETRQSEVNAIRAQVEQRQQLLESVMSDPQKLSALVMAAAARRQQPTQPEPTAPQPITQADLPTLQQQFAQTAQAEIARYVQQAQAQAQEQQLTTEVTTYTQGLLKGHPVLGKIPGIDETIYATAAQMGPKTMDEAKHFINVVVEDFKSKVGGAVNEARKQDALDKSKVLHGIEPKGGAPIVPSRKAYKDVTDQDIVSFLDALGT